MATAKQIACYSTVCIAITVLVLYAELRMPMPRMTGSVVLNSRNLRLYSASIVDDSAEFDDVAYPIYVPIPLAPYREAERRAAADQARDQPSGTPADRTEDVSAEAKVDKRLMLLVVVCCTLAGVLMWLCFTRCFGLLRPPVATEAERGLITAAA